MHQDDVTVLNLLQNAFHNNPCIPIMPVARIQRPGDDTFSLCAFQNRFILTAVGRAYDIRIAMRNIID